MLAWRRLPSTSPPLHEPASPAENLSAVVNEVAAAVQRALHRGDMDLWFPRRIYLDVLRECLRSGLIEPAARSVLLQHTEPMTRLAGVALPQIRALSNADLIALRRSDELFGRWRDSLSRALTHATEAERSFGADFAGSVQQALRQAKAEFEESHRKNRHKAVAGVVQQFIIGATAGAITSAAFGFGDYEASLASGAATGGLTAGAEAARAVKTGRGVRALEKHFAVVIGGDGEGGDVDEPVPPADERFE